MNLKTYLKHRLFLNVKDVPIESIDNMEHICFTYTVQPKLKVLYTTNKGVSRQRYYSTLPFVAQKAFLTKGINQLNCVAYYFEKHNDGRFHLHAYCFDTPRNYLVYAKDRYTDCKMETKADIQDFCLLGEIAGSLPSWVLYCKKEQTERDLFDSDIENYLNGKLDFGVVKIEYNSTNQDEYKVLNADERQFENYLFGKKKFLVEF